MLEFFLSLKYRAENISLKFLRLVAIVMIFSHKTALTFVIYRSTQMKKTLCFVMSKYQVTNLAHEIQPNIY
jgi:hypothetical protein